MLILDDRPEAAGGAGAQALFEEARRRRLRRRQAWIIGWVTVVLFAAGLSLVLQPEPAGGPGRSVPDIPGIQHSSGMPVQIVVWTGDSGIEVLSASTGRVLRTVATGVAEYRGLPSLSVSPSGMIYFDKGMYVNGAPAEVILRVPVTGGRVARVAQGGRSPAVSPDGRFLAYVTGGDASPPPGGSPEAITVLDLSSGTRHSWRSTSAAGLGALSWSPDSRYLSFTSGGSGGSRASYLMLDRSTGGGSLSAARPIAVPEGIAWAGFLGKDAGRVTGVGVRTSRYSAELVTLDASSGRILRRLVAIPAGLFTANAFDGPEGSVQADPSGRFLLAGADGTGRGQLYRWSAGSDHATALGTGIIRAVWVPALPTNKS
jgi:dipeptidyl aminopeptidase/acylaminoacyl peptidase